MPGLFVGGRRGHAVDLVDLVDLVDFVDAVDPW